jgi:putative transposase
LKYVDTLKNLAGYSVLRSLKLLKISPSKYYSWVERKGLPNQTKRDTPSSTWLLPEETQNIVNYCQDKIEAGYRRLSYMMIDEDIVAVSPSTVFRVLKKHDLLNRWSTKTPSSKGTGFIQPLKPNDHWHTDISYVNILGTFFFLMTVLDGYSRKVLHHELRANMTETDVEIVIQKAIEFNPDAKANLITDNGSQYISKDFKGFIKNSGLEHIRTSVAYPQSNGKIERFHRTIKSEKIRVSSFVDIEDAREQINTYIKEYNEERLHSAIGYLTPNDVFNGFKESRLAERKIKIDNARIARSKVARLAV